MSDLGKISVLYAVTWDRRSKHSPSRLWWAITDPEEVSRWMNYPARIDLRVGGDYWVDFSRTGEGGIDGVITKIEPERLLWYAWGHTTIKWELEADGEGCRYRFVDFGQPPRDVPDEEGLAAGWHAWLEDLDRYLDGTMPDTPPGTEDSKRWLELKRQYRPLLEAALGDALTPGK